MNVSKVKPQSKVLVVAVVALAVVTILGLGSLFRAAPEVVAQSQAGRSAVNQDLAIDQNEVVEGDVSVTDGNLKVNGTVQGNVSVLNGDALIDGKVSGSVV